MDSNDVVALRRANPESRIPLEKRGNFIKTLSTEYIKIQPLDSRGKVHVEMVRIEVEAEKLEPPTI